jgi:ankyrin repeat protein
MIFSNKVFAKLLLLSWCIVRTFFASTIPRFVAPIVQFSDKSKSLKFAKFTKIDKKKALDIKPAQDSEGINEILQQMFDAIDSDNIEDLEIALSSKGADINARDENDATALIRATWSQRAAIVKFLLTQDHIDVNAQDKDGSTALHLASNSGCIEIVRALLSNKNINIEAKKKDGTTPLILAVEGNRNLVVELLIQNKADINAKDNDGGSPLLWAIRDSNIDIVNILLENKADINICDNFGRTPLIWSVYTKNLIITKALLSKDNLNINAQNIKGKTALDTAERYATEDFRELLIENGAIKGVKISIPADQDNDREPKIFSQNSTKPDQIPSIEASDSAHADLASDQSPEGIKATGDASLHTNLYITAI